MHCHITHTSYDMEALRFSCCQFLEEKRPSGLTSWLWSTKFDVRILSGGPACGAGHLVGNSKGNKLSSGYHPFICFVRF